MSKKTRTSSFIIIGAIAVSVCALFLGKDLFAEHISNNSGPPTNVITKKAGKTDKNNAREKAAQKAPENDTPERSPVTVLMYHKIAENTDGNQFTIPLERFEKQMQYLVDNGYESILTEDYVAFLENEEKLPEKPVMITFDDWTPGQYKLARPVLNRLGLHAVFFVITGKLKSEEEKEKLKKLHSEGHEIGSHTIHHYYLTQKNCNAKWKCCRKLKPCTRQEMKQEIYDSKKKLEAILGKPVISFSWPGNYFNEKTEDMAKQAGYKGIYAVERQVMEDGVLTNRVGVTKRPARIYRTEIGGQCTIEYFEKALKTQRCCLVSSRKFHRYCIRP